jgi:hypothetical protein
MRDKRKSREIDALEDRQAILTLIDKDPGSAAVALDDADFLKKHPSLTLADQAQLAKHADQARREYFRRRREKLQKQDPEWIAKEKARLASRNQTS